MSDKHRLIEAINEFEATLLRSSGAQDRKFEDGRKAAVDLRRKIAVHRAEITALIEGLQCANLTYAFRSRFSDLCTVLALHQASWPVVTIDLNNPDYLASSAAARAK